MKILSIIGRWMVLTFILMAPVVGFAQISSPAGTVVPTEYTSGPQDDIHVFCAQSGQTDASLTATSPSGLPATFEWLKYNAATGAFDPYQSDMSGATTSVISNLQDGAYRVNITSTAGVQTFTAWVLNNFTETTAAITASDCNLLSIAGTASPAALTYTDLSNNQPRQLNKNLQIEWKAGNETVGQFINYQTSTPPPRDTEYTLTVTDRFNCSSQAVVSYTSIVTKASFTYVEDRLTSSHPDKTEAPLTVRFTNTSENDDPLDAQWFIFKDRDVLLREGQAANGQPIDSILTKIYVESPTYVFERPGVYNVKLVSQKTSPSGICYDTVYIDDYITIDTSFIEAPNFFTPGDDGANDQFIVRFFSMQSVKISIFNRWGKVVHVWESNNVRGFGPTLESTPQAVWDGKIGGRMASPGVYYFVAEGRGRDDKKQKANGFFHLFRDK